MTIELLKRADGEEYLRCSHTSILRCQRRLADGRIQVGEYCGECGRNWRARKPLDEKEQDGLPWFDQSIVDAYDMRERELWDKRTAERKEARELRSQEWWVWYNEYLLSPEWRTKRAKVLKRASYICEAQIVCDGEQATQAHHLTYDHVGQEPLFDLRAVCVDCHEELTLRDRTNRGQAA